MHRPRLIFVLLLLLLVQSAPGQSANFKDNLWFTTWNRLDDGAPQLPPPSAPWRAAMWTTGVINGVDSTADDVANLAKLCRYGGPLSGRVKKSTIDYLRFYGRLDCFPKDRVPASTLLIVDYEGAPEDFRQRLWDNVRPVTKKYACYPSLGMTADVDDGIAWPWTSQLREIDFFCVARVWSRATPRYIANCGDYVLVELYVNEDPATQEQQYRVWAVLIASLRARLPDKKILGLVCSYHPWPSTTLLTADERHREARFVRLSCDGVWLWGIFDPDLPADIVALADDSLMVFPGQNWARQ